MKKAILFSFVLTAYTGVFAQSRGEQQVAESMTAFNKAMLDGDSATISRLTDEALVYGHSSGKMESRGEFVNSLGTGASDYKTLNTSDQTIVVKGRTAVVRYNMKAEIVDNGKASSANLGVLLVWHREKKQWKILARQAYKR